MTKSTGVLSRLARHWLTALALGFLAARYLSDSLLHRRKQGQGYVLHGEDLDVDTSGFLHAADSLTSAPISIGNDLELLVNGDPSFPAFLETIANARRSVNLLTFVYWRGDIAGEVAARRSSSGPAPGCGERAARPLRNRQDGPGPG